MELRVPAREREQRLVCTNSTCGFVDYLNPKMVRCWLPVFWHSQGALRWALAVPTSYA